MKKKDYLTSLLEEDKAKGVDVHTMFFTSADSGIIKARSGVILEFFGRLSHFSHL